MWDVSAFSLTAVELRTDRHQHHADKADGQNDEVVDGLDRSWSRLNLSEI